MIEPMEIGSSPAEAMLVRRAYSMISQAALENEIGDRDDTRSEGQSGRSDSWHL